MTRYLTLASALLALAAAVPAVHAEMTQRTEVHVSYADLNLGTRSGQQILDRRVSHAIDKACGERPDTSDLVQVTAFRSCEKTAWTRVQGQLKSLKTFVAVNTDAAPGR